MPPAMRVVRYFGLLWLFFLCFLVVQLQKIPPPSPCAYHIHSLGTKKTTPPLSIRINQPPKKVDGIITYHEGIFGGRSMVGMLVPNKKGGR